MPFTSHKVNVLKTDIKLEEYNSKFISVQLIYNCIYGASKCITLI